MVFLFLYNCVDVAVSISPSLIKVYLILFLIKVNSMVYVHYHISLVVCELDESLVHMITHPHEQYI